MTALILLTGVLFIGFVLVWFTVEERYRTLAGDLGPAEREARKAADLLEELALRSAMEKSLEAYDEVFVTLGVANGGTSAIEWGEDHGRA
jgi:hypothetical protein